MKSAKKETTGNYKIVGFPGLQNIDNLTAGVGYLNRVDYCTVSGVDGSRLRNKTGIIGIRELLIWRSGSFTLMRMMEDVFKQ